MLKELAVGAAAGTIGALPMTVYWDVMHKRLAGDPPRPMPPREVVEAAVVKAGVSREMSERDMRRLATAAHFGYGAATGALFGLVAPRHPAAAAAAGMLFGVGVWAASYLGWLPATGFRHHPKYDVPTRTGLIVSGHLVWGATLGLVAGALRK